jgi:heparin binding hemagglutinin HbhA
MAIKDDLRNTLTDTTPAYFVVGTADLAFQQAKKVPGAIEQLIAEAPARIDAVRNTDTKAVQDKAVARAKEAQETLQTRFTELLGSLDTDFKKLSESAQGLALSSVGVAAEYAVKAREQYEKVAEHGEQAVRTWRGEAAEEINELAVAVEPDAEEKPAAASDASVTPDSTGASAAPAKKPAAKKAPAPRKPAAKKTTPPAK